MSRVIIGLVVALAIMPTASSWMCRPATWMISMEEEHKITPQEVTLSLENDENSSIHIVLRVETPSSLTEEYEPLPNMTWVIFEQDQFTIDAHEEKKVKVTVDIPNMTENYGKAWEFFICADQTAGGETQGGAVFQYDYNLRWKVRTPAIYVPVDDEPRIVVPVVVIAGILIVAGVLGKIMMRKSG